MTVERGSQILYARNGDVHLAYHVFGSGSRELLLMSTWFISIEAVDEGPAMSRAIERLAGLGRIVLFDRRGVGLSDPSSPDSPPTLEQWAADALAVCDEVGFTSPVVLGMDPSGGLIALFLAATHPQRVGALVLFNTHARAGVADDYPEGMPATVLAERVERSVESVMHGDGALSALAPELASNDPMREWWITYRRRGASPAMLRRLISLAMLADVRPLLPAIRSPTLVMHCDGSETVPVALGRYLADHIDGARFVELRGRSSLFFVGDTDAILGEIEEFVTGTRSASDPRRMLATVCFTDIVASTQRAAAAGDAHWGELLDAHHAAVRRQLVRFGGVEVKTTGDGFLATFAGPAQCLRFAEAVRDVLQRLGIDIRIGVHVGEVEASRGDLSGIAVHIAERVMTSGAGGDVMVSRTVVDLVTGSELRFEDRGTHELKGVPGMWSVFALRT